MTEERTEETICKATTLNKSYICSQIIKQLLLKETDLEVLPNLTLAIGKGWLCTKTKAAREFTRINANYFDLIGEN